MQINFEEALDLSMVSLIKLDRQESRKEYENNNVKTERSPRLHWENMQK